MNSEQIVTHFVFLAHGSPAAEASEEVDAMIRAWLRRNPRCQAYPAYLSIGNPNFPSALQTCATAGAKHIEIIPLFLFSGKHLLVDIPKIVQEFQKAHPELSVHLQGPLSSRPGFIEFLSHED